MSESEVYDIVIVGGGMVGATLAVALSPLKLRVALIEAVEHNSAAQPSFDERTTALSNGSRRILETIGVWPELDAVGQRDSKNSRLGSGAIRFRAHRCRRAGLGRHGLRGAQPRAGPGTVVARAHHAT